jgi:hypothetical protein
LVSVREISPPVPWTEESDCHTAIRSATRSTVNPATGAAYDTLYGLFFGQEFGRVGITNAPGTGIKRIDYVDDTDVNTHSIGAALVTIGSSTNSKGVVRSSSQGQMQWMVMPRGTNGTKVCVGTFRTARPLIFGN